MNKEIEEILNELKDEDNYIEEYGFRYKRIALDDWWLLLSYIEQIENNRDKAIEFIEEKRKVFEWYDTDLFYLESLLEGGSDE